MAKTIKLTESELKSMIIESVKQIIEKRGYVEDDDCGLWCQTKEGAKLNEGMNDEPSNTHYAIHKPTGKIVFSWDYTGYDPEDLKLYKKDYFTVDLLDMGMDPKEVTVITRKSCEKRGIDPTDDNNWSNYPMQECAINEAFYRGRYDTSERKIIEVDLCDVAFQQPLDEWVDENIDNLPSDSVRVALNYSASAYKPAGDLPSEGGEVKVDEITVDENGLFKEALGEYYPMFIDNIKAYVNDNIDYYDSDFEIPEPERDYDNERY